MADKVNQEFREGTKEILRLYELGVCRQECIHPSWRNEDACLYCMADQILVLIPDEELIRKDERERIINELESKAKFVIAEKDRVLLKFTGKPNAVIWAIEDWQALKGEGKTKNV